MDQLYREAIIDHYKYPRHHGSLADPDYKAHDLNPFCGDELTIEVKVDGDGIIRSVAFNGKGCAISLASASMLMEEILHESLDEVKTWTREDILDMLGIEIGPVRMKCAMLSLKVLKKGIYGLDQLEEEEFD
jgi:nitrogen fixation NifU-like protein